MGGDQWNLEMLQRWDGLKSTRYTYLISLWYNLTILDLAIILHFIIKLNFSFSRRNFFSISGSNSSKILLKTNQVGSQFEVSDYKSAGILYKKTASSIQI